ncbi:hypothetical protein ACFYWX_46110 [Streptomyces sp. NPDC002888]|uniref:hypothetical protein n=1 Tax=Streptomyces sp. NPDC002888 TaxID=3364668 RepID=UPI0036CE0B1C
MLAVVASWSGLLLVVAGQVVPGWGMSCVLLCISLVLMRVRTTAHRSEADEAVRKHRVVPRWLLVLSTAAAALSIVFGVGGDLVGGAEYYVLEPEGPGGCRVVVRETSVLVIGNGDVYEVGASGLGRQIGSWTADDGYRPFRSDTYRLDWGRGGGILTISGTGTDPVLRSGIPAIDCD